MASNVLPCMEVNTEICQLGGILYFRTLQEVPAGTELVTDYGRVLTLARRLQDTASSDLKPAGFAHFLHVLRLRIQLLARFRFLPACDVQ